MRVIPRFVLLGVVTLLSTIVTAEEKTRVEVMIDFANHKATYTVNSVPVAYRRLLRLLEERKGKWPDQDQKVVLLTSGEATLAQVDAVRGIIAKAGYKWPEVFYFDKNKRQMVGLNYTPAVPFSSGGASEK
jgi:hypothetical protein